MGQQSLNNRMDVTLRIANSDDWVSIARIHIDNWKNNYRGIYSDEFLDNHVEENRNKIWESRLSNPLQNQHIIVAVARDEVIGFSCSYLNYKDEGKHYLDNLHVQSGQQGKRIGERLLLASAKHAFNQEPKLPFYLLVFDKNQRGVNFYKRLGAKVSSPFNHLNEDGTQSSIRICEWSDLGSFNVNSM